MPGIQKFRFYFSFRSPFAGIAFYRLRRSALFNEFEVELIPVWPENVFGGHMDNPTDNLFKMAYIFADAARQAEEAGLSPDYFRELASRFQLPENVDYREEKLGLKLPPEPWEFPHHAFLYAQEQGRGWEFGDAVFARRFNFDGAGSRDVLDPEVIFELAEQVSLDTHLLRDACASGRYAAIQAAFVKTSEVDGVFGVPFFAFDHAVGKEVFWGNDRLPFLYKAMVDADTLPVIAPGSLSEVQPCRS